MAVKVVELTDIRKVYQTGDEQTVALDGIDIIINQGQFVAIMGPSGSGKSTLMHIIGLLDQPTSGEYRLDNQLVSRLGNNRLATLRNQKIGFVFQQFNLLPRTSVIDNVLLPTVYGYQRDAKAHAEALLKQVDLTDRMQYRSNQLSGGQIQRVAIARALVMNPSMVLADEPTGNLDSIRSAEIMGIFQQINRDGATVVLITHEPDIAAQAGRVITLKDGRVQSDVMNKKGQS